MADIGIMGTSLITFSFLSVLSKSMVWNPTHYYYTDIFGVWFITLDGGNDTVVHWPNSSPFPTSEYEHSSIAATVKKLFNLSSPFLTKRVEWAGSFEGLVQTKKEPRTDCPG